VQLDQHLTARVGEHDIGDQLRLEGRMFTLPWNGASALALILTNGQNKEQAAAGQRDAELALRAAESENRELKFILDAATDGVLTLDGGGRIVAGNARAVALFARGASQLTGRAFAELLAPGSEAAARDYFERIVGGTTVPAGGPEHWIDPAAFFSRGTSGQWRDLLDDADLARYAARVRALASDNLVEWVHREPID